jgi:hypothetical protein
MRTKRRGRKKMSVTRRKQSGGDPTFTVITFNVESWNTLINDVEEKNKFVKFMTEPNATTIEKKENWKATKDIFMSADIICVQEDALVKDGEAFKSFISQIGDHKQVASCQSHNFYWPTNIKLYGVGSKLANSIYSVKETSGGESASIEAQLKNDFTINTAQTFERCWAISKIKVEPETEITIASIHLSGGRQDDMSSLVGDNFIIKIRQIHELVTKNPELDIFCLDSNSKLPKNFDAMTSTVDVKMDANQTNKEDKYFTELSMSVKDMLENKNMLENPLYLGLEGSSEPVPTNTILIQQVYELIIKKLEGGETYMADWTKITLKQKWYIWMYGLDHFIKKYLNFQSVYDTDGVTIEDTTIYGGTVDGIYYKANKVIASKVEFVEGVIDFSKDKPLERKILSDHRPVKATFTIKK